MVFHLFLSNILKGYEKGTIFPKLTLGTWTYLFQGLLICILMIMRKKFVPSYLFSFVVGFAFGEMMDLHELWITRLPLNIPLRILYFVLSYIIICFGIALSNRCKLPIIPTDLFPREVSEINCPYHSSFVISSPQIVWFHGF